MAVQDRMRGRRRRRGGEHQLPISKERLLASGKPAPCADRGAARTVVRVQAARVTSTREFLNAGKTFATHSLPRLERGGERGADTYRPRRAGRASPAAHASTNNQ